MAAGGSNSIILRMVQGTVVRRSGAQTAPNHIPLQAGRPPCRCKRQGRRLRPCIFGDDRRSAGRTRKQKRPGQARPGHNGPGKMTAITKAWDPTFQARQDCQPPRKPSNRSSHADAPSRQRRLALPKLFLVHAVAKLVGNGATFHDDPLHCCRPGTPPALAEGRSRRGASLPPAAAPRRRGAP